MVSFDFFEKPLELIFAKDTVPQSGCLKKIAFFWQFSKDWRVFWENGLHIRDQHP